MQNAPNLRAHCVPAAVWALILSLTAPPPSQLQYIEKLPLSFWERCSLIVDKKTEQLEELMVGMEDFLRDHIETSNEVCFGDHDSGLIVLNRDCL